MRSFRFPAVAVAATLVAFCMTVTAEAYTPGVDMPLHTGVYSYLPGHDDFQKGTVRISHYMLRMERTYDPQNPNQEIIATFTLNGPGVSHFPDTTGAPVEYPSRSIRFNKDDWFYNAVDWRSPSVATGLYMQEVFVTWPAGYGEYTGRWYPAGATTLILPITVRP